MQSIGWRFPPLLGGKKSGYTNQAIECFKGEELIHNLAREICQNSLDAKQEGSDEPVRVRFRLKYVPTKQYDVFSGYQACIKGCEKYWGNKADDRLQTFLADANAALAEQTVPILIASDFNTKGLVGSHDDDIASPWEALTGAEGLSVKSNDNSGGSYGIGKNAPYACSQLSMVFYNTYAEDEEKAFVGVAQLATLYDSSNRPTQGVGTYRKNDDEAELWTPIYSEDSSPFRDLFNRDRHGTDIIIVGFNQTEDWLTRVAKAVLSNFFVAINENKLVVELEDGDDTMILDNQTLPTVFANLADDSSTIIAYQLYKAYITPDKTEKISILSENDAELFIKWDNAFNRVTANFRSTGMMVGQKRRRVFQHFAAVLIVRGDQLDRILRDTEPTRHNKWDHTQIDGNTPERKKKRKQAKEIIDSLEKFVMANVTSQSDENQSDTLDAAGLSEFLPDNVGSDNDGPEGDDILRAKIKIGKVRVIAPREDPVTTTIIGEGEETEEDVPLSGDGEIPGTSASDVPASEGTETHGDSHRDKYPPGAGGKNPRIHPNTGHLRPRIKPEDDVFSNTGTVESTTVKKKTVLAKLLAQRAFPINSSMGLYKIVIKTAESYDRLYVECAALGEDGRADLLEMVSFNHNGASVQINQGKAGPIKVEAGVPTTFVVRFDTKEKMVLKLQFTEVRDSE